MSNLRDLIFSITEDVVCDILKAEMLALNPYEIEVARCLRDSGYEVRVLLKTPAYQTSKLYSVGCKLSAGDLAKYSAQCGKAKAVRFLLSSTLRVELYLLGQKTPDLILTSGTQDFEEMLHLALRSAALPHHIFVESWKPAVCTSKFKKPQGVFTLEVMCTSFSQALPVQVEVSEFYLNSRSCDHLRKSLDDFIIQLEPFFQRARLSVVGPTKEAL